MSCPGRHRGHQHRIEIRTFLSQDGLRLRVFPPTKVEWFVTIIALVAQPQRFSRGRLLNLDGHPQRNSELPRYKWGSHLPRYRLGLKLTSVGQFEVLPLLPLFWLPNPASGWPLVRYRSPPPFQDRVVLSFQSPLTINLDKIVVAILFPDNREVKVIQWSCRSLSGRRRLTTMESPQPPSAAQESLPLPGPIHGSSRY